ncbi:hypothetical protein RhiJN_20661 [Ceratobasidium sp. AG-Ba]|nr:hypothetical protein RhiJN_20661 [Ceratobasidium sp. AG-Ba]
MLPGIRAILNLPSSSARVQSVALTAGGSNEPSIAPPSLENVANSDSEPESVEAHKPATRKRSRGDDQNSGQPPRQPVKRLRGKTGKLKGLMNMPIEVFTEISKHLYPIDLILLARANKFFRALLMNRSAIQTWQCALSNVVGLPPCPKDLCEPQYAALVFSKYCSVGMCGNQALRLMDPVLQVRLCTSCRDSELMPVGYRENQLVNSSYTIILGKGRRRIWWCLRRESAAILSKLDELDQAGDRAAKLRWEKEKMHEITQRAEDARPLVEFLRKMENEQKDSLAARKGDREGEIHSRLLELGWVAGDFRMRETKALKKWNSLVCVAKPLTQRNWETILPQLTDLLEHNRELRLKEEIVSRRYQRSSRLYDWIKHCWKQLPPYVCVAGNVFAMAGKTPDSMSKDHGSTLPIGEPITSDDNAKNRVSGWPTPATSSVLSWQPIQLLLETDRPFEEFQAALDQTQLALTDLLVEWKAKVEKTIASRLPSDPAFSATINSPREPEGETCSIIPELDILVDSHPIDSLPLDIQRLFRADTIFTCSSLVSVYPDDMQDSYESEISSWRYNGELSNIARALLVNFGRPNANYLDVKAIGSYFACGRCCTHSCVTWKQLVTHFYDEKQKMDVIRKLDPIVNGTITYVFTHDIEPTDNDLPLAKLADDEDKEAARAASYLPKHFSCAICLSLDRYNYHTKPAVIEHLRDVHLVQDPEERKHYR